MRREGTGGGWLQALSYLSVPYLCATCALPVVYLSHTLPLSLFSICPLSAPVLYLSSFCPFSLSVPFLFSVHYLSPTCALHVPYMSLTCPLSVPICALPVSYFSSICLLSLTCPPLRLSSVLYLPPTCLSPVPYFSPYLYLICPLNFTCCLSVSFVDCLVPLH